MSDYDRDRNALDAAAKRDADIFARRQEVQDEQRKREHARTVQSKVTTLERDLSHTHAELGAIKLELPRLRDRIDISRRATHIASSSFSDRNEERSIEEISRKLEGLKRDEQECKSAIEDHTREIQASKRINSEVSEEMRGLHTKLSNKEEQLRILQRDIQTLQETIAQTESKVLKGTNSDHEGQSLETKLHEIQNTERRSEDELDQHKKRLVEAQHTTEKAARDAEEEGRVAAIRLRDQERKAEVLEQEVRKIENEIANLKRELQ